MQSHMFLASWVAGALLMACVTGKDDPSDTAVTPDVSVTKDIGDTADGTLADTDGADGADGSPEIPETVDDADASVTDLEGTCGTNDDCDDGNHCTDDFCNGGQCFSQPKASWWESSVKGFGFPPIVRFLSPGSVYATIPTWPNSAADPTPAALFRRSDLDNTSNQKTVDLPEPHFFNNVVAIADAGPASVNVGGFGKKNQATNWGFWVWNVSSQGVSSEKNGDWTPAFTPQVWTQVDSRMVFAGSEGNNIRLRTVTLFDTDPSLGSPSWQGPAALITAVGQADGLWLVVDSAPSETGVSVYRAQVDPATQIEATRTVPHPADKTGFITTILSVPSGGALLGGYVRDVDPTGNPGLLESMRPWIVRLDTNHDVVRSEVLATLGAGTQILTGTLNVLPGVTPPKEPTAAWAGSTHGASDDTRDAWVALTDVYGRFKVSRVFPSASDDYLTSIVPHPDGGFLTAGIAQPGTNGTVELRRIGPWASPACSSSDACDASQSCLTDGNPCTFEACVEGACTATPLQAASVCGEGGLVCTQGECALP